MPRKKEGYRVMWCYVPDDQTAVIDAHVKKKRWTHSGWLQLVVENAVKTIQAKQTVLEPSQPLPAPTQPRRGLPNPNQQQILDHQARIREIEVELTENQDPDDQRELRSELIQLKTNLKALHTAKPAS